MVLTLLLVFFISLASIFVLLKQASNLKLIALPGGHRQHLQPTPLVGGLGICFAILVGVFLLDSSSYQILPSLVVLCALGALDDRYSLHAVVRFIAQGAAAFLMICLTGVKLNTLGFLFSQQELLLGGWATSVTVFACIGVINAVNMSDGLDGLAGSFTLLILLCLCVLGSPDRVLILIACASVSGFLFWNIRIKRLQARVFMGDSGSTMLGLLVAYLMINYSQEKQGLWPVTALWIVALPLIDAVTVMIVRPLRGRSPFSADRIHYHHQLRDAGLSVSQTLLVALALQLALICLGVTLWWANVVGYVQFYCFLGVFFSYMMFLLWKTKPRQA